MNIFNKIFKKELKRTKQNFSEIINSSNTMFIFLTDDPYLSHNIIEYVYKWNQRFNELIFIVPDFTFPFFKMYEKFKGIKIKKNSSEDFIQDRSVILNFNKNKRLEKTLNDNMKSIIIDINDNSNLKFIPKPDSILSIIEKFADFFDLAFEKEELNIALELKKIEIFRSSFLINRFPNYILDIQTNISKNQLNNLAAAIKQNFSANIYLTGKEIGKNDFVNIKELNILNLLDLFSYSQAADLFITDNANIAQLFSHHKARVLYLGNQDLKSVRSVSIKDTFELKNIISDITKKGN